MQLRALPYVVARKFMSPERFARFIGVNVGKGCYISTKNFSSEPYLIHIGNNVRIAKGVSFFTHGALWPFRKQYPGLDYFGKIHIGNNCYIGQDAKILPGVTIEDNCIIGTGAVVTKSVKQGMVVAGNPAKIIGKTVDFLSNITEYNCNSKHLSAGEKKKLLLGLPDERFVRKKFM